MTLFVTGFKILLYLSTLETERFKTLHFVFIGVFWRFYCIENATKIVRFYLKTR